MHFNVVTFLALMLFQRPHVKNLNSSSCGAKERMITQSMFCAPKAVSCNRDLVLTDSNYLSLCPGFVVTSEIKHVYCIVSLDANKTQLPYS
jgi:hypothetical protein